MGRCSDARDRLLLSASRLIHDRGYSAVSVSDICDDAGLKKGSFYHFFPSKRDLVLAAIDRYAAEQARAISAALDPQLPAVDQLRRMFSTAACDVATRHAEDGAIQGCPLGNLALEMAHRDPAIRDKVSCVFAQWRAAVGVVLGRAVQRGELQPHDTEAVAEAIVAYVEGAILMAKASGDPDVMRRLERGVEAIVLGAIQVQLAPPGEWAHRVEAADKAV
jgi:TetR/AcrR family transcriptional repressor of nem operon